MRWDGVDWGTMESIDGRMESIGGRMWSIGGRMGSIGIGWGSIAAQGPRSSGYMYFPLFLLLLLTK